MTFDQKPVREKTVGVQFVEGGPMIPVELLQSLEDGRLVIFCGAGVSRRCGLPDFKTLVTDLITYLGQPMEADEQDFFDETSHDIVLGLIEHRIGKQRVRLALSKVLKINPGADLATHEALLQLATSRQGHVRLVTTNFDQGFQHAGCAVAPEFDYAPFLPVPGGTWSSIVHLHGGLGDPRDTDGQNLIFTSADFGRAYLTDGWAAKFLAELFRRSAAILFVGYSVSDPAIRYLVDAFAADRADEGARAAKAYILAGSIKEHVSKDERTWRSRGLVPLTYEICDGDHRLLHDTLRICAKRYKMGLFDRTSIIREYGTYSPVLRLDKAAVSQITWALQDSTGHSARYFATLTPSPPLDWLEVLTIEGLFSLAPSHDGLPAVAWGPSHAAVTGLHPVVAGLCVWLLRKLADPRLLHWVIKQGSHLHPDFARLIRATLADKNAAPLPKGVEPIWRLLSAPSAPVHCRHTSNDIVAYLEVIRTGAWNPVIRDIVLFGLAPTVSFKEPSPLSTAEFDSDDVESFASIELTPASGRNSWQIADKLLSRTDAARISLDLLSEVTHLLRRGLEHLAFLGRINNDDDGTYSHRPSIDDHPQNRRFHDWTVYIYLLRDAWHHAANAEPGLARAEVANWANVPYPLFRRFVLWSAAKIGGLSAKESVEYIVTQPISALWGLDTHRELLQYLRRVAPLLSREDTERLCDVVLAGPPKARYRADLTEDAFQEIRMRAIRLRLLKLKENGASLTKEAEEWLHAVKQQDPEWPNTTTERDEFVVWSSSADWVEVHHFEERLDDYLDWTDERVSEELQVTPSGPETLKRWRGLLSADQKRAEQVLKLLAEANRFDAEVWSVALDHLSAKNTRSACIRLYGVRSTARRELPFETHRYPHECYRPVRKSTRWRRRRRTVDVMGPTCRSSRSPGIERIR
ncbi:MAG: SIR2 family protein [Acidobacteriota bacterium]|nr:SIR2 family protein [Acidobacteriota bacterium]